MMLTVTRPIEQALLEVPGIRRVRSTTFRGATEISAQFDPATDMVVALQQAQGTRRRDSRIAAGRPRADGRAADAGGVSVPQRQPDRRPAVGGSLRLRVLRDAAGAVARARRRQRRSAGERHARDRSHRRSRAADRRRADDRRRRRRAAGGEQLQPVGRYQRRRPAASGARVRHVEVASTTSPTTPLVGQGRRDDPRRPTSRPCSTARPIARRSSAATARSRRTSASRSRSARTSSTSAPASKPRSPISRRRCRPA